jgi:transposase
MVRFAKPTKQEVTSMCTIPKLSPAVQKQIVRQARHRGFDAASMLRLLIVLAAAAGRSHRQVAMVFHCAASKVSRAVHSFAQGSFEALRDQRCHNGTRKLSDPYLERLHAVLDCRADEFGWQRPTWTRESLALTMAEQNFPLVAPCTMGRALHAIGARRGRPKPSVQCPWPKRLRDKVLRSLKRLEAAASDQEPVVFADEVDLHLNPKVGQDWMNQGTQRELLTPGQNKKHYLAGALDSRSERLWFVDGPQKNSTLFCRLLDTLIVAYPDAKTIHVILDNYGIHKSSQVTRKLATLGERVQLHFLPPYCPDHNRIERAWQELHANVTRNHRCKSLLTLLFHVFVYLAHANSGAEVKPSLRIHTPVAA